MSIYRSFGFWFGIGVSTVCLYLAISYVDAADLELLADRIDWAMATLCGLATLASILARVARWRWMLPGPARFSAALSASGIGFLFTNILPMRLGDAARLFTIARTERISGWHSAASILIERFLDIAICLAIFMAVLPMIALPDRYLNPILLFALAIIGVVSVLWALIRWNRFTRRLPRLINRPLEELVSALSLMTEGGHLSRILIWTVLIWVLALARQWFGLSTFVEGATLLEAAVLTAMLNLSMALPSAPANVGVFHYVGQLALVLPFADKYSPATGLGIATVLHLHFFVLTMLIGVIGIWLLRRIAGERWTWQGLKDGVTAGARSALTDLGGGSDRPGH